MRAFYNLEIIPSNIGGSRDRPATGLALALDGRPFMYIYAEENRVRDIVMVNASAATFESILSATVSGQGATWSQLYYGAAKRGVMYGDVDCDGRFDRKSLFDTEGNIEYAFIWSQESWVGVDSLDSERGRAQRRDAEYVFTPYRGWEEMAGVK